MNSPVPYLSAANGVAEWTFRVIFRSVRILLLEAKMAHGWWAEACDYAVKVANLLPTSQHRGKCLRRSGVERNKKLATYGYGGSMCYAKIPVAKGHSKLSHRGQKGRFIRLAGHGSYRIVLDAVPGTRSSFPVMSYLRSWL